VEDERVAGDHLPDQVVLEVVAHPLDDRDDGDEEHDPDGDTDQREEALELLNADLSQGELDGF